MSVQELIARLIASNPAGENLCLIGGFRYRLLDGSPRRSLDVDYHYDGDLAIRQREVASLLRRKLIPEAKTRYGLDGMVSFGRGPEADNPSAKTIDVALFSRDVAGSRIDIPVEITRIVRLDPPVVRAVGGVVYLSVSDADMIEGKVLCLFNRLRVEERDIVDIFLFHDRFLPDSPARIGEKFRRLPLPADSIARAYRAMVADRSHHERNIRAIIDEQVDPPVAANINAAGGAGMVFDRVTDILAPLLRFDGGERS
ncbi:MAG: hypothetical protein PHN82_09575 [bacterium]|nr:hypothetical protein [bacterium]